MESSAKNPPFDPEKRAPRSFDWTKGLPTDHDDPEMNKDPFAPSVSEHEDEGDYSQRVGEGFERFLSAGIKFIVVVAVVAIAVRVLWPYIRAAH